ncbi:MULTISPECIES: Kdo hydroxylase family protein [Serratia]|uniref:Kdo hydroxylase family protein n=1 Tax=Serratia ureilytica TaxID=300181 RepID=A0ABU0VGF8_9GAMM|nr:MULTISPECIES: Kdo hydroxylase family protein [Serratia]ASL93423.1 3-deoxy-D-manno-oct-2-ulosonic acid (Kdo) hydroxylase [Serratia marcescens]MBH2558327.1 Kdo hydroxylase family protein [Serratia ureilytica]MBH2657361.1 Kdo hydroxylase family protein [Serratia ureilytica]MBH2699744.1 Kdo hydroxylase family protein [Serratia ureilytica]MBH2732380.1 Kdo hydroxylase family protein [Serratia ureilytica]
MPTGDIMREQAVLTLPLRQWAAAEASSAVSELEQGKVLFLPELAFTLSEQEMPLLDPALVDPKRKNISYQPLSGKLTGVAVAERRQQVQQLLERYYQSCRQLIAGLLPEYQEALHHPTGSLRLHPVSAWRANSSWRKDDSRLHVDAFPSRPNYGERILRIFTNINPHGEHRQWRVGEPFPELAQRFMPRLARYSAFSSWLQHRVRITKTRRSHYDHLMLQLHDAMKADGDYQQQGPQLALAFPPGSSWICFSDQTPHAAMGGQFMLEQTFLLPVNKMQDPQRSPLKVLEQLRGQPLI